MKWFVFKTSDEAGENLLSESTFEDKIAAMAEVFTLTTVNGPATIVYKPYRMYEMFVVTPEKSEPFFVFIAGYYEI